MFNNLAFMEKFSCQPNPVSEKSKQACQLYWRDFCSQIKLCKCFRYDNPQKSWPLHCIFLL